MFYNPELKLRPCYVHCKPRFSNVISPGLRSFDHSHLNKTLHGGSSGGGGVESASVGEDRVILLAVSWNVLVSS